MTKPELEDIVGLVEFRDWIFRTGDLGDGWFVQGCFVTRDTGNGRARACYGRKWYISPYSIADEVVKTCWLAVETALKHEAMEEFVFFGQAIFHPHTDVDALAELQGQSDCRVRRAPHTADTLETLRLAVAA